MTETPATQGPAEKYDYRKSVAKFEDKYILPFLRIDKFLNRPVASLIVRALYRTGITPNQLTYLAFGLGLAAAYAFSRGRAQAFLVGGLLAQASSIMDNADGMLARARNQRSEYGGQLDLFLDRVNEFFLLIGIVFGQFRADGHGTTLAIGLTAMSLYFLQVTLFYMTKNFDRDFLQGETGELRSWMMALICLAGVLNGLTVWVYVFFSLSAAIVFFQIVRFLFKPRG